ncbi:MAG TPA: cohesin domain-containing protein [Anaerolineaceae bacterium]|nr:cohesin domain-containing protein [Anaerolineaceae bacterium]HQP09561.1 cohesin domain-containing protein [Anaerolineaceae bacterium]
MKKSNLLKKCFGILVLLSLAAAAMPAAPAHAQGSTTLTISPVSSVGMLCDIAVIAVRVENVANLNAYDISVSYPEGQIEIIDITNGEFLDFGFTNFKNISTAAGVTTARLSMTQVNPSTPKTGSGDLVYLHIRSLVPDVTVPLTIVTTGSTPTKISDSSQPAQSIPYSAVNGSITTTDECPYTTEISIDPPVVGACTYNMFTVKVKVRYAVDLHSYALNLNFNPGSVMVASVKNGGFLEDGIFALTNGYNNSAGTISFEMTQQGYEVEPKTGSGDLISIDFIALVPGATVNLTINDATSTLVNWPDALPVPYVSSDGIITTQNCEPTNVELLPITTTSTRKSITVNWETVNESDILGFNVLRARTEKAKKAQLNQELIPTQSEPGSMAGAVYSFEDKAVKGLTQYFYWVEVIDINGESTLFGPVKAKPSKK